MLSGASSTADWVPTGGNALVIAQGARNGNQYNIGADIYITGGYGSAATGIPVVAGKRYELSCKVSSHRSDAMIAVDFFDAANTHLGGVSSGWITPRSSGGKQLSNWSQAVCFGVAPANAAYASIYFRKSDTDTNETSSYAWFTQPHFGLATEAQTVASAYTPGTTYAALTANWGNVSGSGKPQDNATYGATFGVNISGKITANNIATYMDTAVISDAYIGTLNAAKIIAGYLSVDRLDAKVINTDKIANGAVTAATIVGIQSVDTSFQTPVSTYTFTQQLGAMRLIGVSSVFVQYAGQLGVTQSTVGQNMIRVAGKVVLYPANYHPSIGNFGVEAGFIASNVPTFSNFKGSNIPIIIVGSPYIIVPEDVYTAVLTVTIEMLTSQGTAVNNISSTSLTNGRFVLQEFKV